MSRNRVIAACARLSPVAAFRKDRAGSVQNQSSVSCSQFTVLPSETGRSPTESSAGKRREAAVSAKLAGAYKRKRPRYVLLVELDAADALPPLRVELADGFAHAFAEARRATHADDDAREAATTATAFVPAGEEGGRAVNDAGQNFPKPGASRRQRELRGQVAEHLERVLALGCAGIEDGDAEVGVAVVALREEAREQRHERCELGRVLHAPHELHRAHARAVLGVLLHQVLHRRECERDARATRDEHRPRERRENRVAGASVRTLDHDLDVRAKPVRLAVLCALCERVQLVRPVPSLLDEEHEALAARGAADAGDGEGVALRPATPAHAP